MIKIVQNMLLWSMILCISLIGQFQLFKSNSGQNARFEGRMAQDSSGYLTVCWEDWRHSQSSGDGTEFFGVFYFQRYDANSNILGANIRVSEPNLIKSFGLTITIDMNNSGDILFSYKGQNWDLDIHKIFIRLFDLNGVPFSPSVSISDGDNSNSKRSPDGIILDDGKMAVLWIEDLEDSTFYTAQFFESWNQKRGPNFRVSEFNYSHDTFPIVLKFPGNRIAFCLNGRYLIIYDKEFNLIDEWIDMGIVGENVQVFDNDHVIIFTRGDFDNSLHFFLYNILTKTLFEPVRIDDDMLGYTKGGTSFARGNNGRMVMVWNDYRNYMGALGHGDIYGQLFAPDLSPIGNNFKVNHEERENDNSWSSVISRGDRFLAIWTDRVYDLQCDGSYDPVPPGNGDDINGVLQPFDDPVPGKVLGIEWVRDHCNGYPGFGLGTNYPNPFNSSTTVRFTLFEDSKVQMVLYNSAGQKVAKLLDEQMSGEDKYGIPYEREFNLGHRATGIYFLRMKAAGQSEVIKINLIK